MTAARQQAFADALLEGLARQGCREVVLSPGSRSTPLALAASRLHEGGWVRTHPVVDERAAAFLALGIARTTFAPVALVCTSGSAPFHYLPAMTEAATAFVPLLLLSADRPTHLHHRGAHQTAPQRELLVPFARRRWDVEPATCTAPSHARTMACRLAAESYRAATDPGRPGPVHLNIRFRKPLEPPDDWPLPLPEGPSDPAATEPVAAPEEEGHLAEALRDALRHSAHPLVVLGPRASGHGGIHEAPCPSLPTLPLAPEAASGFRFVPTSGRATPLGRFDAWMRDEALRAALPVDHILQLGATPLSSGLDRLLSERRIPRTVLCAHGWPDPWRSAEAVLQTPTPLRILERALHGISKGRQETWAPWARWLQRIEDAAAHAVETVRMRRGADAEGSLVATVVQVAAEHGAVLLVGNSLPVRQLDLWCPASPLPRAPLPVVARRGVAGIDGVLAEAAGVNRSLRPGRPLVLLLGDTTFRHDQGALELLCEARRPLLVVVLDNGGGRIFEELPLAAHRNRPLVAATMERLFRAPGGVDPVALARAHGLRAERFDRAERLPAALREAMRRPHATLLHLLVGDDPVAGRREAFEAVREAVRPLLREAPR